MGVELMVHATRTERPDSVNFRPGILEPLAESLTPTQLAELIKIAHKTKDSEIKKAALMLVTLHLYPPMFVVAEKQ
jgi:hypothetical protein